MTDQRKEVINQLHELNILILHTKLKATRAQTALRAATRVCNVEAARRGVAANFCNVSSTTPTPDSSAKSTRNDVKPSMNSLC